MADMPVHVREAMELAQRYLPSWACEILKRGWSSDAHPRDEKGRFTSGAGMANPSDVHEIGANARTTPPPLPKRQLGERLHRRTKATKADYSREYLEEALNAARQHLPGWAYALIHQKALPASGGRSKGRSKPTPDTLAQVAMRKLTSDDLADLSDNDLLGVWGQMQSWAGKNPDDATLIQAANAVIDDLNRRGIQVDVSSGLGAAATLRKAAEDGAVTLDDLGAALAWYGRNAGDAMGMTLDRCAHRHEIDSVANLVLSARRAMDSPGSLGYAMSSQGESAILLKSAYGDLRNFVPSAGPRHAPLAFVGACPSVVDAARGEPFTSGDGAALVEHYLAPLGLSKRDVLLANVVPMVGSGSDAAIFDRWIERELDAYRPRVVVALGRVAKAALGPRAQFYLPHPAVVRKNGDKGELPRKLEAIAQAIAEASRLTRDVAITKADSARQICYGVVLDPYQIDTQGDWCPAKDIEDTAHDYMEKSRVVGLQHGKAADAVVLESHVVQYPTESDYLAARANQPHRAYRMPFGDQVVHSGAWVLGVKVRDPKVWADIEKGAVGAYSIGGDGVRSDMQLSDMPNVQFIDLVGQLSPGQPPLQVAKNRQ